MLFTNLFSIFGLLTAFSRVSFSLKRDWKYVANTNLDDRVCDTAERLVSDSARHAIECGVFCTQVPGCYSFFFNTVTKECRGCDRTYNQWSPTLAATGMKYFGPVHETTSCKELQLGGASSGVYHLLSPLTATPISVYCDMTIQGGGWMVWQNRYDGSLEFVNGNTFDTYVRGFGHPDREYWLGLEYLHEFLTWRTSEVYLQLTDFADAVAHERYDTMHVSPSPDYTLTLGPLTDSSYTITNAQFGFKFNDNQPFSTQDNVQNAYPTCTVDYGGGWWYWYCTRLNLNGRYGAQGQGGGDFIYAMDWHNYDAIKGTRLMIRETP